MALQWNSVGGGVRIAQWPVTAAQVGQMEGAMPVQPDALMHER